MKITAFLIRVAICLLLSLIPVTELENRIYSLRMELRGHWGPALDVVLIELQSEDLKDPKALSLVQAKIAKSYPLLVLLNRPRFLNHLVIDSDGVVRKALIESNGQKSLSYSVYSQLSQKGTDTELFKNSHLINYRGPSGTFPRCTFTEFQKNVCPSIQKKIVLLTEQGDTSPALHTPIGDMSSGEVLANEINTVMHRQPIIQVPFLIRLIIMMIMILTGAFFIIYYPVVTSAIAITGTGAVVVIVLFQGLFQIAHIYIPSANIICSLLITYLIFTGYRLALQENLQWRSLKQAQYLRELDRMKTNFLSLVSHDLKTPLAKIQAIVERLRRELLLPAANRSDWKELIDSIENSNNEMRRYITSILNLSKIESQKVILNKKSNDINLLIQQALTRLKPLAQQKNLKLEEFLDPLFSIECDEDLMRQVLSNLIDNAIKYSPPDSKIIVRSREEGGFVRVDVEDFGPGIPKDQLPLMFRKFSRFLRPIKEQIKGSGLGLYLSKYFIELHGGTIRVKSIEGQGTTFSFTLPLYGTENENPLS